MPRAPSRFGIKPCRKVCGSLAHLPTLPLAILYFVCQSPQKIALALGFTSGSLSIRYPLPGMPPWVSITCLTRVSSAHGIYFSRALPQGTFPAWVWPTPWTRSSQYWLHTLKPSCFLELVSARV